MTKVQMIVTENGNILNFDNVSTLELMQTQAGNTVVGYTIIAYVGKEMYRIKQFADRETAQTCLMSELKRAKQTDGIARFDGDIMARLHERG